MKYPLTLYFFSTILLIGLISGLSFPSRASEPLYVAPNGVDHTSCTRANPCRTLQHAINQARVGAEIRVAAGDYGPIEITTDQLTIQGGYAITRWTQAVPERHRTVIDGGGKTQAIINSGAGVILRGLHITGGWTDAQNGAGLFNTGSLTLDQCQIYGNVVDSPDHDGGGIMSSGTLHLQQSRIFDNEAGRAGGGLSSGENSTVVLDGNHIYDNRANNIGGGVMVFGGVITIQNNLIYDNTAINSGLNVGGGGLYLNDGRATVRYNTIAGNHADHSGGGVYAGGGTSNLNNNLVVNNTAGVAGGGLHADSRFGGPPTVSVSANDFYGNSPNNGSGLIDLSASSNRFNLNPQFSAGLHLSTSSPAIGQASGNYPATDVDGENRGTAGATDRGADEYVAPRYGVEVSPALPRIVGSPSEIVGQTVRFSHTITNTGNTDSASFSLNVQNSQSWPSTVSPNRLTLFDGESQLVTVEVTVPASLSEVNNQTTLTVQAEADSSAQTGVMDLIGQSDLRLTDGSDLAADPSEVVTVTFNVRNSGTGPDTIDLAVSSSYGWAELTSHNSVVLQAGENRELAVQVSIPDSAPADTVEAVTMQATSRLEPLTQQATRSVVVNDLHADRFVATDGLDTLNNCSQSRLPCASVGAALRQSHAGETVFIAPGSYQESPLQLTENINLRGVSELEGLVNPALTVLEFQGRGRGLLVDLPAGQQPEISGLTLSGGQTSGVGGAIYLRGESSPRLENLRLVDSAATHGGGIYLENGSPILQDVTIVRTRAMGNGGGLYLAGGAPTLNSLTIDAATATQGGGIYVAALADQVSTNAEIVLAQSQLINNTASESGGGLYVAGLTLKLFNNVWRGNTAQNGGGLYLAAGEVTAWHNTLYDHSATQVGGAIFNQGSLLLRNTIVATNSAPSSGGLHNEGGSVDSDYNGVWTSPTNATWGANSVLADPLFVNRAHGDLRLTIGSPLVDAGDSASPLTGDQAGDFRPLNQGFDIGAYEVNGCLARLVQPTHPPTVIGTFGVLQDALDAAANGYEIQVAGTCRGVQGLPTSPDLTGLNNGSTISQTAYAVRDVTIRGGYDPAFNYNPRANRTVLDAQGAGRVLVVGREVTVALYDVTLTGGSASGFGGGPGNADAGGAIYSLGGAIALHSVTVQDNQADYGAGVFIEQPQTSYWPATLRLFNSVVQENRAVAGGGLYLDRARAELTDGAIRTNQANRGGGIYVAGGTLVATGTTVAENVATLTGGGLYNVGGQLNGYRLTVRANQARQGAGLHNGIGGQSELSASHIAQNVAQAEGGGLYSQSQLDLHNSSVGQNQATVGAGIYDLSNSGLTVRHSVILNNAGDGIYGAGTDGVVNSSVVLGNTGWGLFTTDATSLNVDYNNVYQNGIDYGGVLVATDGRGNLAVDPLFASTDEAHGAYLSLIAGSPLEDAGDPASPLTADGAGDPRPSNYRPDIGLDELADCFARVRRPDGTLSNLYGQVQAAVEASPAGGTVLIAGRCAGVVERDGTAQTVRLNQAVNLEGGYTRTRWDVSSGATTILDGLNAGRVLYATAQAQSTVSGLTLQNGQAVQGGAVFMAGGSLNLTHNIIADSSASQFGGGVYQADGLLVLDGNRLRDNTAASRGGGFYHAGGSTSFWNNVASSNNATLGGAIFNGAAGLTMWHNTLVSNQANSGSGLYTAVVADARNNNFANNAGNALYSTVVQTFDYNNVYPASSTGSGQFGDHHLSVAPQFADSDDYHLADGSPLIDAGDSVGLTHDFDQPSDIRPSGQGFDIGVDERTSCLSKIVRTGQVFGSLQTAVDQSQAGDTIHVATSVCDGVNRRNGAAQTVYIDHDVTIRGGFYDAGLALQADLTGLTDPQSFEDPESLGFTVINPQGNGRGIVVSNGANVTLNQIAIINGQAEQGGGLYQQSGTLRLTRVAVFSNSATAGGAIYQAGEQVGTTLVISHSWLAGNVATDGGAVHHASQVTLGWGTRLFGNTAQNTGATIYQAAGRLSAQNSLFYDNVASQGGAIYQADGESTVWHNTFYQNQAATGGAIRLAGGNSAVKNNIFAHNQANSGAAIHGATGDLGYNGFWPHSASQQIGGGVAAGKANAQANPLFEDADGADFHLQSGSALIDAGLDSAVTTDMDGSPRPINSQPDLGADEYDPCLVRLARTGQVYGQLQSAIDGAQNDDLIQLAYGFCAGNFTIDKPLTLSGSWEKDFSRQLDIDLEPTATSLNGAGLGRVVTVGAGDGEVSLTRLQLINGQTEADGGGLWSGRDLKLTEVVVRYNQAQHGGGLFVTHGITATLSNVLLGNNTATQNGGGLYLDQRSGAFFEQDVTLFANQATRNGGGAYLAPYSRLRSLDDDIQQNEARQGGGLFADRFSDVDLRDGRALQNNQAEQGGGIFSQWATMTIERKNLASNRATNGHGGGLYANGTTLNLTNLGAYYNEATLDGGAIYQQDGTGRMIHATVRQNDGRRGGGVFLNALRPTLTVSGSIIAENTAFAGGSGLYGPLNLVDSLRWENEMSGVNGAGNLVADPQFLHNSGGELTFRSPAIDRLARNSSEVATDANGDPRPQLCGPDLGAEEYTVGQRGLTWLEPTDTVNLNLAPTERLTRSFVLHNVSEQWQTASRADSSLGAGTGYTETVRLTVSSTHGWVNISRLNGQAIPLTTTAEAEVGPDDQLTVEVSLHIPAGTANSAVDEMRLRFEAQQCATGPVLAGESERLNLQVAEVSGLAVGPVVEQSAVPGGTVRYSHVVTNIGNSAQTFEIATEAGPYSTLTLVEPANGSLALSAGASQIVVADIRLSGHAPHGQQDVSYLRLIEVEQSAETVISQTVAILPAGRTRYVAPNGLDSVVDETLFGIEAEIADNNCSQPNVSPCRTLQQALNQARGGDLIKLAEGQYLDVTTVGTLTQLAIISKSVTIAGGYQTNDWTQSDPFNQPTVLDGQNGRRVLYIRDGLTVQLSGLWLTNGQAKQGGLIYNEGAQLTLMTNRLEKGQATLGGGLYQQEGDVRAINNLWHGQFATRGGAIYLADGTAELHHNSFYDNHAIAQGGAVWAQTDDFRFGNNIISGQTSGNGGAVRVASGQVTSSHNLFYDNRGGHIGGRMPVPALGNNDQLANPAFANPRAAPPDLRLTMNSAARDGGSSSFTQEISQDFAGVARWLGANPDLGAFEFEVKQGLRLSQANDIHDAQENSVLQLTHHLTNTGDVASVIALTTQTERGWLNGVSASPPLNGDGQLVLLPGQVATITLDLDIPAGSGGLLEQIQLVASVVDDAAISAISNDTVQVTFTPGLRWDGSVLRGDSFPEQAISYQHRLVNTGTGYDSYHITTQPPAGWQTRLISDVVTLAPSEAVTIEVVITPPNNQQAISGTRGTTWLTAQSQYQLTTTAQISNVTQIGRVFGLIFESNEVGGAFPGGSITYIHNLDNQGNYTETISLSHSPVPESWQIDLSPAQTEVGPGLFETVAAVIAIPINYTQGGNEITYITATLHSNPQVSDIVINNTTQLQRGVVLTRPQQRLVQPGEQVAFQQSLQNTGNLPVREPFKLALDTPPDYEGLVSPLRAELSSGQAISLTTVVNVPPRARADTVAQIVLTGTNGYAQNIFDTLTNTLTVDRVRAVEIAGAGAQEAIYRQTVWYTHTVVNTGNDLDEFVVSSRDQNGWPTVIKPSALRLDLDEAAVISVGITIGSGDVTNLTTVTVQAATSATVYAELVNQTTRAAPPPPDLLAPDDDHHTQDEQVTFRWQGNGGSGYQFYLNGVITPTSTLSDQRDLAEGAYLWSVAALDEFGERGRFADFRELVIDQTPPEIPVPTSPDAGQLQPANVVFAWQPPSDNLSSRLTYTVMVTPPNGETVVRQVGNRPQTQLGFNEDGMYQWRIQAIDQAGNGSPFSEVIRFEVDATRPNPPALDYPLNGTLITHSERITLEWSPAQDGGSGIGKYFVLVQGLNNDYFAFHSAGHAQQTMSLDVPLNGEFLWTVWADDQAGNSSISAESQRFLIDRVDVAVRRLTPPNHTITNTAQLTFTWAISAQDEPIQLDINQTSHALPAGQLSYQTVLSEGVHQWAVRPASDLQHQLTVTDWWTVTVDLTPPTRPIARSPVSQTLFQQTTPFSWTASQDELSGVVAYRLVITSTTTRITHTVSHTTTELVLNPDIYHWQIQAIDEAGNASAWRDPMQFMVQSPTQASLLTPPNGAAVNQSQAVLRWSPVLSAQQYRVTLSDTIYHVSAPTTTFTLPILADGVYSWTVSVLDAFSQTVDYTPSYTFVLDNTPPLSLTLLSPSHGAQLNQDAIAFDWSDGVEVLSPPISYTLELHRLESQSRSPVLSLGIANSEYISATLPADGDYQWTVSAQDQAGNRHIYPTYFTFTVQTVHHFYLPIILR